MSVSVEKQAILMSLEPLFQEAAEKSLWFFHESDDVGQIWCSPDHLREKQSKDEYVWAPEHWMLRNPEGYMDGLRSQAEALVAEFNGLAERLGQATTLQLTERSGSS